MALLLCGTVGGYDRQDLLYCLVGMEDVLSRQTKEILFVLAYELSRKFFCVPLFSTGDDLRQVCQFDF